MEGNGREAFTGVAMSNVSSNCLPAVWYHLPSVFSRDALYASAGNEDHIPSMYRHDDTSRGLRGQVLSCVHIPLKSELLSDVPPIASMC